MEYSKILKGALDATKRYKAMWLLGMFVASSASGCNSRFPTSFGSGDFDSLTSEADVFNGFSFEQWFSEYWWILALLTMLIFFLVIISVVFHNIAVGGMFFGAKQAVANQPVKFNDLFRAGMQYFPKMFGLHVLVKGGLVVAIILMAIPLIALAFTIIGLIVVIPVAIVLLLALIPVGIALQIILMYARQYIVLQQQTIINSLKLGWQLFKTHLADSIVIFLLAMVIGWGVAIATCLVVLVIGLPFAILGFILYNVISWAGVVGVACLALLVLLVVLYTIKGISQAFMFHLWHRTFAELQ